MDLENVNVGFGPCAVYSPAWTEVFVEALNEDCSEAHRQLRRIRAKHGPMRIIVEIIEPDQPGGCDPVDTCEVYGWRAALVAIRAMGAGRFERTNRYGPNHRTGVIVRDAHLVFAMENFV